MTNETTLDFSMRTVPEGWASAAGDAPALDTSPLRPKRKLAIATAVERVDVMTAVIAALAISVAAGVAWYAFETNDVTTSPVIALATGLVIAIAVRLGGGAGDPDIRASISFLFYLATVVTTAYMIERHDFLLTYGQAPSVADVEYWLVRDRLKQPIVILGWAGGLVLSTQVSYLTRKRR